MRRLPVFLLLDVSESMIGSPHLQLEAGMREIQSDLLQDPYALECAFLSIIVFAGRPKTLIPLTPIEDFSAPHLPVGGGTGLGRALVHLMDEIDRHVVRGGGERKGDRRPFVFLMTDGRPTDDPEPAIRRWKDRYADQCQLVAISIGPEADVPLLRRLTEDVVIFDPDKPNGFRKLISWISSSISASSRIGSDTRISLKKLDPEIEGQERPAGLDDRCAVFVARCARTKAPYVMKYVRHEGLIRTNDPRLSELLNHRAYLFDAVAVVQGDYFELSDEMGVSQSRIPMSDLIGQPNCPHCGVTFSMAICSCGHLHCVKGDGPETCPWCGQQGNYQSSSGEDAPEVTRGRG